MNSPGDYATQNFHTLHDATNNGQMGSPYGVGHEINQRLGEALKDKGNVIVVTGVPYNRVNEVRKDGTESGRKKHPGINAVNRHGLWDSATAEGNVASGRAPADVQYSGLLPFPD
ncbi:hypothetical protein [Acidiphilium sp.]|uniref:hypothetical protein n=1 Tax=Acidiphilium sp. TaxID=527 RepID=UPI003CFDEA68